jgi:UDP:flavonoid glycosyltransferase YjiC (YdhE family)
MRVLFIPRSGGPPYHLMVPLAWSLRNAGHEVRVAGPPELVDTITDSGLPAVAVEGGSDEATAEDLTDFVRAWGPEAVVHSPGTFAGPLAASVAGAPGIRFLDGHDVDLDAVEPERKLLARLGAAEADPAGVLTLDPRPPALRDLGGEPTTSLRHVPYDGPGIVPDWLLDQDRPTRLCVLDGPHPEVEAEIVGAVEGVPLNLLLPACDGVIHGGAADVTLTAAALGVPQLIVAPADRVLAERVAATGAALLAEETAPRERVAELLDVSGPREAARRLRDDIAALPSPVEIARVIEDTVEDTKGTVTKGRPQ